MPRQLRNGRPYERLKAEQRARDEANQAPCCICGRPINYELRFPNKWAWSLEHRVPLAMGGAELDPQNCGASHFRCNSSAGARLGAHMRKPNTTAHW